MAPLSSGELSVALPAYGGRGRLDEVLAALNAPQREVAARPAGPLLVLAGPGAGKTRAIVARVAHLLLGRGEPPDQIAAVTFSRRAAGELQARLASTVGGAPPAGEAVWAGTFHALGARILRRGGARLFGRPPNFTIYDQDDSERALRRILSTLGVPPQAAGRPTTVARQAISLAKRRAGPAVGEVSVGGATLPLRELAARYEEDLGASAAFDFDDLISAASGALDRDAELRRWVQHHCRHLLVDEYQDTDPAQEALLRRLSPVATLHHSHGGHCSLARRPPSGPRSGSGVAPHDLCVVADPQQSIYAFRGAVPEQVQRFMQHWPDAGVIRLEQNYRSTKSIVAVARRLVALYAPSPSSLTSSSSLTSPSGTRASGAAVLNLRLWTDNPAGEPARLWVAPHPEKEAAAIAGDIAAKLAVGWPPEELAVLVRTHAQARPIEAALLRAKVPYMLAGGVRFFVREEIKDALAYLRLAALPEDAAAFWRIVNTPRRGLGPAALLAIARHALSGGGRPMAGARRWAATDGAPAGLYDLLAHIDELTALQRTGVGPRVVLEMALQLTGYRAYVRRQHPDDVQMRLDAIAELLSIADTYGDTRRFLDEAALSGEQDDPVATPVAARGRVRLSTVHAAKGLEFRAVYVPGCEQGLFPLAGSRRDNLEAEPADAAAQTAAAPALRPEAPPGTIAPGSGAAGDPEERRVFYVAVTRAREVLTLSYCTFRHDTRTQPSPYLAEIGRGLLRRAKLGTNEPAGPGARGRGQGSGRRRIR